MKVAAWLSELLGKSNKNESVEYMTDSDGVHFKFNGVTETDILSQRVSELEEQQYLALVILLEQDLAKKNANNEYFLNKKTVTELDSDDKLLLKLPNTWGGEIKCGFSGETTKSNFSPSIEVKTPFGKWTTAYEIEGPFIKFSSSSIFTLTPQELNIFSAVEAHAASSRSEFENVLLIHKLQTSKYSKANIELAHFEKQVIRMPDSVSIIMEFTDSGELRLTPNFGQDADISATNRVLGQIRSETDVSMRVGNEIVLLSENVRKASQEILKNRRVPKDKVKAFLSNPTAFINSNNVDLDVGFSAYVKGAVKFVHAYFGETEESGIDWFNRTGGAGTISPIGAIVSVVKSTEDLKEVEKRITDAQKTGSDEISYNGTIYEITNDSDVTSALEKAAESVANNISIEESDIPELENREDENNKQETENLVVDIELADTEVLNTESAEVQAKLHEVLVSEDLLDWSNYKYTPYPHQSIGVRWIMGLYQDKAVEHQKNGALLADDMGLGKTFMALASVEQLYRIAEENKLVKKPTLIVAPLGVIENWEDEVGKAFLKSPFKDIVKLQSGADLPSYRIGKTEIHGNVDEDGVADIRYSLKIGSDFHQERLDLPGRLVITNYDTLRNYQFSLCKVDWGMVVFDEAQNIKNPNSLQSRAARGLKADFKLVTTGTPVENSLAEFWTLVETARPGYLDIYQNFREQYITPIVRAAGDEVEVCRATIGRQLREKVGSLMLRRIKEDNLKDLPVKRIYTGVDDGVWNYLKELSSTMSGLQLETYDAILTSAKLDEEMVAIAAIQYLRATSLHPRLAHGGRLDMPKGKGELQKVLEESLKLMSTLKILDGIQLKNEKCIIFCVNKNLQRFLSQALGRMYKLGLLSIINGDAKAVSKSGRSPTRKTMIANFENKEGFNVIIMSPVAAGVGLTVVGANNVIHYERHWNPAKEAQATDRVYRIGQKKDVNIYVPILYHPNLESFDVHLNKLLSTKSLLKDAVVTVEDVKLNPEGLFDVGFLPQHVLSGEDLPKIDWMLFEALCAEVLRAEYDAVNCQLTTTTDHGADVVLQNNKESMLVQCKHTGNAKYDSAKAISEVINAAPFYNSAFKKEFKKFIFVTNAKHVSRRVLEAAKLHKVKVLVYEDISILLNKHKITREMVEIRLGKRRLKV